MPYLTFQTRIPGVFNFWLEVKSNVLGERLLHKHSNDVLKVGWLELGEKSWIWQLWNFFRFCMFKSTDIWDNRATQREQDRNLVGVVVIPDFTSTSSCLELGRVSSWHAVTLVGDIWEGASSKPGSKPGCALRDSAGNTLKEKKNGT